MDAAGGIFTTLPVVEVNRGRAEAATLDFAHFANGTWITDLVFVNVATHPIRPVLYFYDKEGHPIAAESMVDLTEDLEVDQRQIEFPQRRLEIPTQGLKKKSCSRPLRRPFPRSSFL